MNFRKSLLVLATVGLFVACGDTEEVKDDNHHPDLDMHENVDSLTVVDSVAIDTTTTVVIDSAAREEYENDLSLEIKEIEEEKVDPISEDCKMFLEEYADEIKSFTSLVERSTANPEDIGLQIQLSTASEDINAYASKPQMFQCSSNAAFQKQVEILNGKRDKLLEM